MAKPVEPPLPSRVQVTIPKPKLNAPVKYEDLKPLKVREHGVDVLQNGLWNKDVAFSDSP